MEGSKGWAGLGLTYLHLDEVGLAKGDELRVRLQLVHVPGLHQGQPVDRALLLWTGGGNKLESCVFLEVTTTTTTTWLTSKRTKPTPGVEITPLFNQKLLALKIHTFTENVLKNNYAAHLSEQSV